MSKKDSSVEAEVKAAGERYRRMMTQARDPQAAGPEKPAPYFRVKKSIMEKGMVGLNSTQRLIGIAIYAHYNPKKGYAWPSWQDIQKFCGISERCLERNLPVVLKNLNIRKEYSPGNNNRYFVS